MVVGELREFPMATAAIGSVGRRSRLHVRCMQFMAFQNISDKIIFGTVIAETSQMIRLYDLDDSPPIIVIESPLDEFPDVCIGPQYSDLFVCF